MPQLKISGRAPTELEKFVMELPGVDQVATLAKLKALILSIADGSSEALTSEITQLLGHGEDSA